MTALAATIAAVYAAYAYADAAAEVNAAVADERSRVLRECADIVRRYYPEPPEIGGCDAA